MAKRAAKSRNAAKLTASITRSPVDVDELSASYHESFALEVGQIGPKEIKKALADSEIITKMLREHPKEMTAIINDFLAGRTEAAREGARKINLTEEAFQRQGGGLLWWFMIGFAAGVIIGAAATQR
jgi:hypothetical protein